ncbi:NAD-dependent epimerase/dehydratase family protein [Streptomyces cyaneofuscatus]|uniref:NAD-dependent epimerase/dehydratase family protein n=1 Tax=Streptomyces cyaneofuscatus TaxID=66883 RepID=UPI00345D68B5
MTHRAAPREPLVTVLGASGFVGSAVARQLARRPGRLRLVARRPASVPADARADTEVRTTDLTEPGALADAVEGSDAVIHLVARITGASTWRIAEDDTAAERVNVGLMRDLIEVLGARRTAGGRPPAVVFAGTALQVGLPAHTRIDGTEPDHPTDAYGGQKLAAEHALKRAAQDGILRGAALRLPTVFGHGAESTVADKGVVATMVRRALAGEPLSMWHDGTVRRDLVYVDDAAAAFLAALDHVDALAGRHWLIGTGRGEGLGAVFTTIADLVSRRTGRPPVPVVSVPPPAQAEAVDFHSVEIDSTAFRTVTGWRPRVPLHDGLSRTVTALSEPSPAHQPLLRPRS